MFKRIFPQLLLIAIGLFSANQAYSQDTLPDLVRRVKPLVVAIATYDDDGEALMTGSGFFVRPGQVVTNLHVMRGAKRAEIKTLDGKGRVFPITGTLDVDEEGDLCLLNVDMPLTRSRASELSRTLPDEGEAILSSATHSSWKAQSATASFQLFAKFPTSAGLFKSQHRLPTETAGARSST